VQCESYNGEQHYADFEKLGTDRDGAFTETVGQESASHGKQNERESEERTHQQDLGFLFVARQIATNDEVDD
jgi:hypothetical protein